MLYNTFENNGVSDEKRTIHRKVLCVVGACVLSVMCATSAVFANNKSLVVDTTQQLDVISQPKIELQVSSVPACGGEASLRYYQFMDSATHEEVLAPPGCSISISLKGAHDDDIVLWNHERIWSGIGSTSAWQEKGTLNISNGEQHSALVTFWTPGVYEVSATVDGLGSTSLRLRCVYVRREIRSLSVEERSNYLTALTTLARIDTEEGRKRYGRDYSSLVDFMIRHLAGATAGRFSDYFHDGVGFLSQHIALTNEFEKALQSIDPTVSVPYWDYTMDKIHSMPDDTKTPVLVAANPQLWREPDGFFALRDGAIVPPVVPYAADNNRSAESRKTNAFGYLRAPWNLNPEPGLTRYFREFGFEQSLSDVWPRCSTHADLVRKSSDLKTFLYDVQAAPHGATHISTGGVDGGSTTNDVWKLINGTSLRIVDFKWILVAMWRLGAVTFPTTCNRFDKVECLVQCPRPFNDTKYWNSAYFDNRNVLLLDHGASAVLDATGRAKVVKAICSTNPRFGEQAEASSPRDPSFW